MFIVYWQCHIWMHSRCCVCVWHGFLCFVCNLTDCTNTDILTRTYMSYSWTIGYSKIETNGVESSRAIQITFSICQRPIIVDNFSLCLAHSTHVSITKLAVVSIHDKMRLINFSFIKKIIWPYFSDRRFFVPSFCRIYTSNFYRTDKTYQHLRMKWSTLGRIHSVIKESGSLTKAISTLFNRAVDYVSYFGYILRMESKINFNIPTYIKFTICVLILTLSCG